MLFTIVLSNFVLSVIAVVAADATLYKFHTTDSLKQLRVLDQKILGPGARSPERSSNAEDFDDAGDDSRLRGQRGKAPAALICLAGVAASYAGHYSQGIVKDFTWSQLKGFERDDLAVRGMKKYVAHKASQSWTYWHHAILYAGNAGAGGIESEKIDPDERLSIVPYPTNNAELGKFFAIDKDERSKYWKDSGSVVKVNVLTWWDWWKEACDGGFVDFEEWEAIERIQKDPETPFWMKLNPPPSDNRADMTEDGKKLMGHYFLETRGSKSEQFQRDPDIKKARYTFRNEVRKSYFSSRYRPNDRFNQMENIAESGSQLSQKLKSEFDDLELSTTNVGGRQTQTFQLTTQRIPFAAGINADAQHPDGVEHRTVRMVYQIAQKWETNYEVRRELLDGFRKRYNGETEWQLVMTALSEAGDKEEVLGYVRMTEDAARIERVKQLDELIHSEGTWTTDLVQKALS